MRHGRGSRSSRLALDPESVQGPCSMCYGAGRVASEVQSGYVVEQGSLDGDGRGVVLVKSPKY